jgi:hypothetical protein
MFDLLPPDVGHRAAHADRVRRRIGCPAMHVQKIDGLGRMPASVVRMRNVVRCMALASIVGGRFSSTARRGPVPRGLTAVLNQPGKPLGLETLPTPEVEPGGILI